MQEQEQKQEKRKMTVTSGISAEGVLMTDGKGGYYREALPPGRELDAKVYEATGRTWFECWNYEDVYDYELGEVVRYEPLEVLEEVPHYSTSIEAAWQIIKYLDDRSEGQSFSVELIHLDFPPYNWQCDFRYDGIRIGHGLGIGVSEPHAICLAYLALVGNESEVKE